MKTSVHTVQLLRTEGSNATPVTDLVVVEEPLEIRLGHGPEHDRSEFRLSVTMRTPGHDEELALGFLLTEGLIERASEVIRVVVCQNVKKEEKGNVVRVELHPDVDLDPKKWQRNFYTTSSCGVCGKSSIDSVFANCRTPLVPVEEPSAELIVQLPITMQKAQVAFKHTGGIHAAALFNTEGELLLLHEDVGRHNAVDKIAGAMTNAMITGEKKILLVSGRAGFELVQKCVMMAIPVMVSVGAPSSLSVSLAEKSGLRLIGFLRGDRYNTYAPIV